MRASHALAASKLDLDRRLEAYFATLRPASLRELLKRSAANWQLYAAVTGSAVAMATGASASMLVSGIPDSTPEPAASIRTARQSFGSSKNMPLMNAIRAAIAKQNLGQAAALRGNSGQEASGIGLVKAGQANPAQAPEISPNGIVPLYGTTGTIEPGEWVTIYGNNLASETAMWNGDFPTSLGGATVEINGKDAYLIFASPDQINLQAPDDTARGPVSVVVTTAAGSATATVTLSDYAPALSLLDVPKGKAPKGALGFVCGIIVRSNGSGAYGGGSYDILGPTGTFFGYITVAAAPGDMVELYGVGFGPTNPEVPAGQAFSGAAPIDGMLSLYINNVPVTPTFVGLSSAGLYQINLTVPDGLGSGEVPVQVSVGGMESQSGVLFSLINTAVIATTPGGVPVTGGGGGVFTGGGGGFTGGGFTGGGGTAVGGGGTGGAGTGDFRRGKHYKPKLKFPPK